MLNQAAWMAAGIFSPRRSWSNHDPLSILINHREKVAEFWIANFGCLSLEKLKVLDDGFFEVVLFGFVWCHLWFGMVKFSSMAIKKRVSGKPSISTLPTLAKAKRPFNEFG
jgi:hypothetical protein